MPDAASYSETVPPPAKKTAVVLIHGIGEQRPMATLWKLVEIAWLKHAPPKGAPERKVFSEPDELSGILDLRRLSTNPNAQGKRTDFFEFYWAHHMGDNDLGDVLGWLGTLASRPESQVPPQLHKAWRFLRSLAFGVAFFAVMMFAATLVTGVTGKLMIFASVVMALAGAFTALIVLDNFFFSPVLGDAARYLRPRPKNIECRQRIREQGMQLLEDLHRSGKYDRIVVVGHSLGGVIGYELICHYWGRVNRRLDEHGPLQPALAAAESAGLELNANPKDEAAFRKWREAQEALFAAIGAQAPGLWAISDLVTLGSPLAHADTLMAQGAGDFARIRARRELSICPPLFEAFADGAQRFTYCRLPGRADDPVATPRAPHNAAAFGATRWTNLYFPMEGLIRGDLVGGPAAGLFGPGVLDVAVRAPRFGGLFPHMCYFDTDADPPWGAATWRDHRTALRAALALEEVALEEVAREEVAREETPLAEALNEPLLEDRSAALSDEDGPVERPARQPATSEQATR